jgi:hypothetical protein
LKFSADPDREDAGRQIDKSHPKPKSPPQSPILRSAFRRVEHFDLAAQCFLIEPRLPP